MEYQIYHLAGMRANPADIALLDDQEREALARRGERYLLIRPLLKRELARRLGCLPSEVHLGITPHGKPTPPHCHFKTSQSGAYLWIALHHQAIGVDIERIRQRPFARLAPRFMAPEQLRAFRERGCPESEFFTCWCTAEALIKHAGSTIWQAHDFPFLFDRGQIIPLYENAPRVHLFSPAPGYSGAVAFTQTT